MYLINSSPAHGRPLDPFDQKMLGIAGAQSVARVLELRGQPSPTPLHALPGLAAQLGLSDLYVKDEGQRLGLGSFKALGGGYALMRLVQQQAARQLNRQVDLAELFSDEIRGVAAGMTFACATDGNHGRSVAQGAQLMGARAVIFVHSGVSAGRIAAISRFGAEVIRVDGNYDDSVAHAAQVAAEKGWTVLSDTSWPGYEEIPGLVMQGYTAIVTEALAELPELPTHIFLQAGVGGFAAAIAGHLAIRLGSERPHVTVVDPVLAPCIYRSAQAGHPVTVPHTHPTAMAMLECYAPSHVAFRILERVADGFMTVEDDDALDVMRRLAAPVGADPAIVAGESGGAGLAGVIALLRVPAAAAAIGLGPKARVLIINTEGATDPALYAQIVGRQPQEIAMGHSA
ncbi:MAG: diaminopropionate ammonia-lyase [Paracoccus denitrificans]|uniref:Diaminopropionate ammonia-lyase n=1 Tax=Paracoccus denitrificans TaxID=266 RepID=A0A533I1G9_PARDE|nr:MAG: diaminopropionate ammonia-lyase [Paracoccus denitrificans]